MLPENIKDLPFKLGRYYPFVVAYQCGQVDKWRLFIQAHPENKVIRKGPMPTLAEMVEALTPCGLPAYMTGVFMVLAHIAEVEDGDG